MKLFVVLVASVVAAFSTLLTVQAQALTPTPAASSTVAPLRVVVKTANVAAFAVRQALTPIG
jgi:hypothetical protein